MNSTIRSIRDKKLIALCVVAMFMYGCASKPVQEVDDGMDKQPAVVPQERPAPPPPPRKPATAVMNGMLMELDDNGEYIAVGDARFYFDFDQALVKREGHAELNKHAQYLAQNANARIRLEGHADERGTREYNLALGERRANAVQGYLTSQGAGSYQIEVISYGEEKPAKDGHSEMIWAVNRRVELIYR